MRRACGAGGAAGRIGAVRGDVTSRLGFARIQDRAAAIGWGGDGARAWVHPETALTTLPNGMAGLALFDTNGTVRADSQAMTFARIASLSGSTSSSGES